MKHHQTIAQKISFCALALSLSVIFLYGASALSTGRLVALVVASFLVMICVERFGVRYALAVYAGTSILSLLFIPGKLFVFLYILCIGYYPIVKLYIERFQNFAREWLLKIVFSCGMLALFYFIFKTFFLPSAESIPVLLTGYYLWLLLPLLEILFVVYDRMLSYMITYYESFIRRMKHD